MHKRIARVLATALLLLIPLACRCGPAPSPTTATTRPVVGLHATSAPATTSAAPSSYDLQPAVEYLASDQLQGRGVGSEGLDLAAHYIAADFARLGLRPVAGRKDYFQPFQMTTSIGIGPSTKLLASDRPLALDSDFYPLSFSAEKEFQGPLAFAGYGISSKQYKYDDYAGLDVKGKVVLAMRFEPHDAKGNSRFVPQDWSQEASLSAKAQAAADHGAVALLLVNPPTYHFGDDLMPFVRLFRSRSAAIPVLQVKQSVADDLLTHAGVAKLAALQGSIDSTGKPHSLPVDGSQVSGAVVLQRTVKTVKNVMACLPGQGPTASQFVVIGAHYDHLGYGGPATGSVHGKRIYHGADDNASGTAAMLHVAEHFANAGPQARSLLFIAFTAEEEGLIGSQHFVDNPPVPLSSIAAMLNMDMVGRLRDGKLYVGGAGTAASLDQVLQEANRGSGLTLKSIGRGGYGPSDHMSFALKKVPVLFLFSGLHADYHRPTDISAKINYQGMRQIADLAVKIVQGLVSMPYEPYIEVADSASMARAINGTAGGGGALGVIPDYSGDSPQGVRITGTMPGSPAATAGLQAGDQIVQFGPMKIQSLEDLSDALAKAKPGDKVQLRLIRGKGTVETTAVLAERKY